MSLAERGITGDHPGEPTNLVNPRTVIDNAVADPQNPTSIEALDGLLRPPLIVYFRLRMPEEADDLAQQTLITINRRLSRVDPTTGRSENPIKNFYAWSYRVARYTYLHALRRRINEQNPPDFGGVETISPSERRLQARSFEEALPQLREKVIPSLTEIQREVFDLALAGKSSPEIAAQTGLTRKKAANRLSSVRDKVEAEVLYPAGIKRVGAYRSDALRHAAYDGTVRAIRLLGVWYTTDDWVRQYEPRRKNPVQPIVIFPFSETEDGKPKILLDWFFTDVRAAFLDKFSWRVQRRKADQHVGVFTPRQVSLEVRNFLAQRGVQLNSAETQVLEQKMQGDQLKEIVNRMGYSEGRIAQIIIHLRELMENTLLTPEGIRQLVTFNHAPLTIAAIDCRIRGVYFFGRWYTTDDEVKKYLERTQNKTKS